MDGLCFIVEEKFYIVNESQYQAREFIMQVRVLLFDELSTGQRSNDCLQRFLRLGARLSIAKRRNGMPFVVSLSRHAVRTGGAGR